MSVIDGLPEPVGPLARYPAGPNLFPGLSAEATVFLDDTVREDEKRTVERWMKQFPGLQREDHPCEKGCACLTVEQKLRTVSGPVRRQCSSNDNQ